MTKTSCAVAVWFVLAAALPVVFGTPRRGLVVDHVTYCGSDLKDLQAKFQHFGLPVEYGGRHAAVTHMALIGFGNGTYLELIAPFDPHGPLPAGQRWGRAMTEDAGPCAWALNVDDVSAEVTRLINLGLDVAGPIPGARNKPDGTNLQWETGFVRPGDPGTLLPFFIHDKTDRSQRVQPAAALANTELVGVVGVVLGVRDLGAAVAKFRTVYGMSAPHIYEDGVFGARVAYFDGTPIFLAMPLGNTGWLAERIHRFGELPAAFLIGTRDFRASAKKFALQETLRFAGRPVAWFSPSVFRGTRVGIIAE